MINKIFNIFNQSSIERKLFRNIKKICIYLYKGIYRILSTSFFKHESFKRIIKIENNFNNGIKNTPHMQTITFTRTVQVIQDLTLEMSKIKRKIYEDTRLLKSCKIRINCEYFLCAIVEFEWRPTNSQEWGSVSRDATQWLTSALRYLLGDRGRRRTRFTSRSECH